MGWDAVFQQVHLSVAKAIQTEQHNYQRRKSYNKSEQNELAKARKRQELFDSEKLQGDIQYEKGMLLEGKQPILKKYEHCDSKKSKIETKRLT